MKECLVITLIIVSFTLYGCSWTDISEVKPAETATPLETAAMGTQTPGTSSGMGVDRPPQKTKKPQQTKGQVETAKSETVKVFYGDLRNEKLVSEERKITYKTDEEKYKAALVELFKGSVDKNHRTNLNMGIKVLELSRAGEDVTVNLSKEFIGFAGSMAEITGVGSIVNTITQFDEIKRVKILVEGEELIAPSGEPRGFMKTFPLIP